MPTLTIKGLPDDVYRRLKRRAAAQRRSLNREIILCLEQALGSEPFDAGEWLAEAAKLRRRYRGPPVTEGSLRALRKRGRE